MLLPGRIKSSTTPRNPKFDDSDKPEEPPKTAAAGKIAYPTVVHGILDS